MLLLLDQLQGAERQQWLTFTGLRAYYSGYYRALT